MVQTELRLTGYAREGMNQGRKIHALIAKLRVACDAFKETA
jgi:hypothetical protein